MAAQTGAINNAIYSELGERWYTAKDDPIALLRAESRLLDPWMQQEIARHFGGRTVRILDAGCGGGFHANFMANAGHAVTGIDLSAESLAVARLHDATGSVRYIEADAAKLPFEAGAFDVVIAMDFLEHVEDVEAVMREAARVTIAGGLFFFHTFNRNPLAWLVIIKLVEWFVPNTPARLHLLSMFLKPSEVRAFCGTAGFGAVRLTGTKPRLSRPSHWFSLLWKRQIPDDFAFEFTNSLLLAYCGVAQKLAN